MSSDSAIIPQARPSGTIWRILWPLLLVAGIILWAITFSHGDVARTWRALLINFIYFTPLAGGMVVWSAVVITSRGHWAGRCESLALAGLSFAPFSIFSIIGLWIGGNHWLTWLNLHDDRHIWLNQPFFFLRDFLSLVGFWVLAFFYVRERRRRRCKILGAWLIVTYCLVFTLLGFDLIAALAPGWPSTVFGMFYFVSGMYIAVLAWTLISAWHPAGDPNRTHDLGKIIYAFAMMTTYMAYANLYPIWYENMPEETRFLVPRFNYQPWAYISWAILILGWMGPIWMLLTVKAKRNRITLTTIVILVLAMMWIESWWLVVPTITLQVQLGLPELSMLLAMLGAVGMAFVEYLHRVPQVELSQEPEPSS